MVCVAGAVDQGPINFFWYVARDFDVSCYHLFVIGRSPFAAALLVVAATARRVDQILHSPRNGLIRAFEDRNDH